MLLPNVIFLLQSMDLLLLISIQISHSFLPNTHGRRHLQRYQLRQIQEQHQFQQSSSLYNDNNIMDERIRQLFFQSTKKRSLTTSPTGSTTTCCYAVKKSKSTTTATSNVGGFGTSSSKKKIKPIKSPHTTFGTTNYDDDYAIFPPLEPDILRTMVPSVPILYNDPGELPDEIYHRLHQIYGFSNFNYPNTDNHDNPVENNDKFSFHDLISSSESSSTKSLDALFPTEESQNSDTSIGRASNNVNDDTNTLKCLQKMKEFTNFRVLHIDPMVLAIDNFFTNDECDKYIQMSDTSNDRSINNNNVMKSQSPTVGKDKYAQSQRTSTTYYHYYEHVPELITKATRLLGLNTIQQWEEPQTVCYNTDEKFTWHLDALGPNELVSKSRVFDKTNSNSQQQQKVISAGQRIATLLVYLTDMSSTDGGATIFRDLRGVNTDEKYLTIQPKKGTAVLFFPAAGGIDDTPFDIRTIHCGQVVRATSLNQKWIAQLWLRTNPYQPSAPPNNYHINAYKSIEEYCNQSIQ
jgi:predicted 2-oxoglutarate/Fe(II)-dependent dioxygenase YbiX